MVFGRVVSKQVGITSSVCVCVFLCVISGCGCALLYHNGAKENRKNERKKERDGGKKKRREGIWGSLRSLAKHIIKEP